jgi:hypothetical protein
MNAVDYCLGQREDPKKGGRPLDKMLNTSDNVYFAK